MSGSSDNSVYRERFACTLAHKPVDRCPIDLGGTPQSTIEDPATETEVAALFGFAGLRPDDYVKFDRRILERFDVDFRRVGDIVPFKTGREVGGSEIGTKRGDALWSGSGHLAHHPANLLFNNLSEGEIHMETQMTFGDAAVA